jgi:hypothetical protein
MIRCPPELLLADSPVELPVRKRVERSFKNAKARNTTALSIRGVAISSDHLSRTNRRVCPACLDESRHHRFWWDLSAITTCPRHKLRLVNTCGCGNEVCLSWRDNNIFHCEKCSRSAPVLRESAPPNTLAADAYLLKRFGITKPKEHLVLDGMTFFDAVDTMERVGAASIGGLKNKWQSAESLGLLPETVRAHGFSILSSGSLVDVLDNLLAEFRSARSDIEPALTTAYGWFYHWLNLKGGRQFSEILSNTFVSHARDNFHLNGQIGWHGSAPPATYTLEKASKECGIGRETLRKLGVKLGMIRPSGIEGHALAFDGSAVRALAEDLRASVDLRNAQAILGVYSSVLHGLVSLGLIAPLFDGQEWRRQYAFRRSDLRAFIKKILGGAPAVDAPRKGQMTALDARRSFNLSGTLFVRLIAEGRVKAVAHIKEAPGVAAALVDRQDLKNALIDMASREDVPVPIAALALDTTNPVVRKLIEKRFLYSKKAAGRAVVTAKSFARFRGKFIGFQEIATILECEVELVHARVAKLGIRYKSAVGRCGFHGFARSEIEAKLPKLKAMVSSDLRFNSPVRRASQAA